jgi:branched-subunit amino acid permease
MTRTIGGAALGAVMFAILFVAYWCFAVWNLTQKMNAQAGQQASVDILSAISHTTFGPIAWVALTVMVAGGILVVNLRKH